MKIAVLNGPSLNLLGTREPHIYGTTTLVELETRLRKVAGELDVEISFSQHNGEGEFIEAIHVLRGGTDGALINAAAYTHTSLALRDAIAAVNIPFVEVHLSNIFAREPERRHSHLSGLAVGLVCGLGVYGYELALRGLHRKLTNAG